MKNTIDSLMLLRNAEAAPTDEVLKAILDQGTFALYRKLLDITVTEFELEHGWRYYNDGKSWLLKAVHGKKTIFWISVWTRHNFLTASGADGAYALPPLADPCPQADGLHTAESQAADCGDCGAKECTHFLRTSFFFTEKTRAGICGLPIDGEIKEAFRKTGATGKLIPLILDIDRKEHLDDFREIVRYKIGLK